MKKNTLYLSSYNYNSQQYIHIALCDCIAVNCRQTSIYVYIYIFSWRLWLSIIHMKQACWENKAWFDLKKLFLYTYIYIYIRIYVLLCECIIYVLYTYCCEPRQTSTASWVCWATAGAAPVSAHHQLIRGSGGSTTNNKRRSLICLRSPLCCVFF